MARVRGVRGYLDVVLAGALMLSSAVALADLDDTWRHAAPVKEVEKSATKFYRITVPDSELPLGFHTKIDEVYVVARQIKDRTTPMIVGRSFLHEQSEHNKYFLFYMPLEAGVPEVGDKLFPSGEPLTEAEKKLIQEAKGSVPPVDQELEDYYHGLMSFKLGYYWTSMMTTTNTDSNKYKNADFKQFNLGIRWWFEFSPQMGLNIEYATGSIPVEGFKKEKLKASKKDITVGGMYRTKFFKRPTIFSLNYFTDSFTTDNSDDFLLGSSYSGPVFNVTFYELFRFTVFRLKGLDLTVNNLELGGGIAPFMTIADQTVKRGNGSGTGFQGNGGLELHVGQVKLLQNFFFVFEGGIQSISMSFSGTPSSKDITPNNVSSEVQYWYGFRLKFNMKDYLGEMIKGT